jgi:hypothetical protein
MVFMLRMMWGKTKWRYGKVEYDHHNTNDLTIQES